METLDCTGLNCPEPVLRAKAHLERDLQEAFKVMEAIEVGMHVARMAQMAIELPSIIANTMAKWGEAGANATASANGDN